MSTVKEQQRIIKKTCDAYLSLPLVPISQTQAQSSRDRPAKGGVWISRSIFPASTETGLKDALFEVIDQLKSPEHLISKDLEQVNVKVEFIGAKKAPVEDDEDADVGEPEKLKRIEKEWNKEMAILYIHGGGL
jgi:hypothetical protein